MTGDADINAFARTGFTLRELGYFELAFKGGELDAWAWDPRTREIAFDSRWSAIHGSTGASIVHPDDWIAVEKALKEHLAGARSCFECQCRISKRPGNWIWSLLRGKIVARDGRDHPTRLMGIALDIS